MSNISNASCSWRDPFFLHILFLLTFILYELYLWFSMIYLKSCSISLVCPDLDGDEVEEIEPSEEAEDMYGAKYLPPIVRSPLSIGSAVTAPNSVRTYRNMQGTFNSSMATLPRLLPLQHSILLSLSLSVYLPLFSSFFLRVLLCFSLLLRSSLCLSHCLCLYLSLSLYLPLSLTLTLSLSLSLCLCLSLFLSFSPSFYLFLSISFCLSLTFSVLNLLYLHSFNFGEIKSGIWFSVELWQTGCCRDIR